MKRHTLLLAVALAVAFSLILVTSFALGQGGIGGKPPPYKLTALAKVTEMAKEAAKRPTGDKNVIPDKFRYILTPPSSCLNPNLKLMIYDYRPMGPTYERGIVNVAIVPKNDVAFSVLAGSPVKDTPLGPTSDKQRGLIIVKQEFIDPCAVHSAEKTLVPEYYYITPNGTLTITRIEGDTVVLTIGGGGTDRFNFVTGQFENIKPLTVTPIPIPTRRPYP